MRFRIKTKSPLQSAPLRRGFFSSIESVQAPYQIRAKQYRHSTIDGLDILPYLDPVLVTACH